MFTQSAAFYDLIYSWKNYRQEVDRLLVIIRARVPEAKTILDVASELRIPRGGIEVGRGSEMRRFCSG